MDPANPLAPAVHQRFKGAAESPDAKIRFAVLAVGGAFQPVEESRNVKQAMAVFDEVFIHDLSRGQGRFHGVAPYQTARRLASAAAEASSAMLSRMISSSM